jgi:hypothetical protein
MGFTQQCQIPGHDFVIEDVLAFVPIMDVMDIKKHSPLFVITPADRTLPAVIFQRLQPGRLPRGGLVIRLVMRAVHHATPPKILESLLLSFFRCGRFFHRRCNMLGERFTSTSL